LVYFCCIEEKFYPETNDQYHSEMIKKIILSIFLTIPLLLIVSEGVADEPEVYIEPSADINRLCKDSDFGLTGRGMHGTENFVQHKWENSGENIFAGTDGPFAVIRPGRPGKNTITYTATDEFGNQASSSITVTVFDKPANEIKITRGFFSKIFGNELPVTLSAEANREYSYQWFKENEIMEGEINAKLKTGEKGNYRLMITSDKGCHSYSRLITID
jgi:hypothetical protein